MTLTESFASEHGFKQLSVATVPGVFARMFEVLQQSGWTVIDRVEEGESGGGQEKVYLIKEVRQKADQGTLQTDDIGLAK